MTKNILVVDNGTGYIKSGFYESNIPTTTFPSVVGRPIIRSVNKNSAGLTKSSLASSSTLRDIMVGDETTPHQSHLDLTYPIENGVIKNWDDMQHIWDYTFYGKFNLTPKKYKSTFVGETVESSYAESCFSDTRLMMTEAPLNPKANRQKMAEIMFETYGFDAMYVAIQAIMTLYAQGSTTGIVVDSGDGVTHIVAISEGHVIPHLTTRLDIAGRHITDHLIKLLQYKGYSLNKNSDYEAIQKLKEAKCYIAHDLKKEEKLVRETTVLVEKYELPDGRVITLDLERYHAPEVLFQPELIGKNDVPGLADSLFDIIQNKADIDTRKGFFKKIVLSGGSTMYPGFSTRLERELKQLYAVNICKLNPNEPLLSAKNEKGVEILRNLDVNIIDSPNRMHSVYLGASILSRAISNQDSAWFSKKEYEEFGASKIYDKF